MYRNTSVSSRGYGGSCSLFTRITWPLQAPSDSEMPSKYPPSCRSLTSRKKSTTTPLLSTWRSKDCLHQGARPRGQRKTSWCLSVYYQFSLSNFHKEVALLFAVTVLCNCDTVSSVCCSDCIFFQFVQKWRSSTR